MTSRTLSSMARWTAVVLAVLIPGGARAQSRGDVTSPRNAVVNATGARSIKVEAGAGFLYINGRTGINDVRVKGVASASSRRLLDDIRLIAERRGDVVFIKMDVPEHDRSFWDLLHGDWHQALDLTIDVPVTIPLDVADGSGELKIKGTGPVTLSDGSGDLEVTGITGNVRITDGSGNIVVSGVDGDVHVDDGSGNIDASNVTGNFTIGDDGSGSVNVSGIGGTMRVNEKGSGSLSVNRVGGDFIVGSKGSGSIDYNTVKGTVNIPERKRRDRRDRRGE
jgi:hypothetical protein